jgi:hypothetical protein
LDSTAASHQAETPTELRAQPTLSRRRALTIAGALAGVLGLGWLADALASLPLRRPATGPQVRQAGTFSVALTLAPVAPVAGAATNMTVVVRDLSGQRVAPARFRGGLGMPSMGMDLVDLAWVSRTTGEYYAAVPFPMAGVWTLLVTLVDASQRTSAAQFDVPVR